MATRYFLTVDWCGKGNRGIFCDQDGQAFSKDEEPHTPDEMWKILGMFEMVLAPESTALTEKEVAEHQWWFPLKEYSSVYGYATKEAVHVTA